MKRITLLTIGLPACREARIPYEEAACIEDLDRPWSLCEDHGEKFGCIETCGKIVFMKNGTLTIKDKHGH